MLRSFKIFEIFKKKYQKNFKFSTFLNFFQPQGWLTCAVFPGDDHCLPGGEVTFSFFGNLGTPHTRGLLIPGDLSYLGTSHTWGPLIPGDLSYLGTPLTWGPHIPGDPSAGSSVSDFCFLAMVTSFKLHKLC